MCKNIYKTEKIESKSTQSLKPLIYKHFLTLLCTEQHTSVRNKKSTKPLFLVNAFPLDKFYLTIYNGMV